MSVPVVVLVDVADRWACSRMDVEVLKCLAQHPQIPAVLVLNKVFVFLFLIVFSPQQLASLAQDLLHSEMEIAFFCEQQICFCCL